MEINALTIRIYRKKLGLTQDDLARLIGVSRNTVINYERGKEIPISKIEILKKALSEPLGAVDLVPVKKKAVKNKEIELPREIEELVYNMVQKETKDLKQTVYDLFKKIIRLENEIGEKRSGD